ncbi:interleukin-17C [Ambystoma mexicanum]|uniref:interleukin-17C n=1 Tax=Ambystoma mexicanum TaxID=8296 RepID=UPI0037E93DD9
MASPVMWLLGAFLFLCLHRVEVEARRHHPPRDELEVRGRHHPSRCLGEDQLKESSVDWVHHFVGSHVNWREYKAVEMVAELESMQAKTRRRRRHSEGLCPKKFTESIKEASHAGLKQRSISPWSYWINEEKDRYPQKLAFAKCLCEGCINTNTWQEDHTLNSVELSQTMMVLRRKPCPNPHSPKQFTFVVEYISVPVGCTCALPRYQE